MKIQRSRLYDLIALLVVIGVLALDQVAKMLVVQNLVPRQEYPFVGHYLVLEYILNTGAAFSIFQTNTTILTVFILLALALIFYLYARIWNTGKLIMKMVLGLIIGGACGNLIDRFFRGGSVVDFVAFRIPEANFYFAVFNLADAAITLGVVGLFFLLFFNGGKLPGGEGKKEEQSEKSSSSSPIVETSEQSQ